MKEIIFDLLSVGKSPKTFTINPEVKTKTKLEGKIYDDMFMMISEKYTAGNIPGNVLPTCSVTKNVK